MERCQNESRSSKRGRSMPRVPEDEKSKGEKGGTRKGISKIERNLR